jgi:chorismate synthase
MMLRYLTGGESHGKALVAILEGIPAGLSLSCLDIDEELARRQVGYGRSERMKIEKDRAEILSGVRGSRTLGSPIVLMIKNLEWPRWQKIMGVEENIDSPILTQPRPGHADLAGIIKYDFEDIRDVLERASARETAARVAVGAICKKFLQEFGIDFYSRVIQIGKIRDKKEWQPDQANYSSIESSPLRCLDREKERKMKEFIDQARTKGDTLGGSLKSVLRDYP